ncbi:iron uptake transporter deferrochelatase/peroxidase subunit [Raineyella fluvialis]|uniref:Deferrochelatase n=1 Tax=Raineyella fluvialis TaxID=2662261 RepID=A0A5Q2FCX2_9ACTN|nr:iron uptake transporter deferrochelatase/peroxidase subunit [Raineyella fluvialis]QGF24782.1 deferrochelatase/peroxidase EfeB [Raineyella fluvialis]
MEAGLMQVGRRGFLGLAGAGAAGAAVALGAQAGLGQRRTGAPAAGMYAFEGPHQAGIVTPAQDRMYFASFDVTTRSRERLVALLQDWTRAARELTAGREVGGGTLPYADPPADTGEAIGLPASGLTLTFGVGPSLFTGADGTDRFGLGGRRPAALETLPHFPKDHLDPSRSDGDLCVQACADDPQVAFHAIRNLTRLAFGTAALRWSQLGFGRTSSTSSSQETPRNLFGFKDGTANLKAEESGELDRHLWVAAGDDPRADWLAGGTYLVARRISMRIETWDRTSLREQEGIFGRDRAQGAPLSGGREFDRPDFTATSRDGAPLIATGSHVRLAHPSQNDGHRMLRRGYNYTDGDTSLGRMDAGLFFVAFVRDPARQYIPLQNTLARQDALTEYLQHTGSGLFACPPGVGPDGWIGEGLFA